MDVQDWAAVGDLAIAVGGSNRRGVPWESSGCWFLAARVVLVVGIGRWGEVFGLDGSRMGFAGIESWGRRDGRKGMLVMAGVEDEVVVAEHMRRAERKKDLGSWVQDQAEQHQRIDPPA